MNSVILQIATKYLRVLLLIFAVLALLRGHNQPGGGFIGGLLAALPVVFKSLAFDPVSVKTALKIKPEHYIAFGLLMVLVSALPGVVDGGPIMQGKWIELPLPFNSNIKIGSPLLFDTGIFFAVVGVVMLFFFTLSTKK